MKKSIYVIVAASVIIYNGEKMDNLSIRVDTMDDQVGDRLQMVIMYFVKGRHLLQASIA